MNKAVRGIMDITVLRGVLFMGKTAIVYYSLHHGNTKKILDAIAGYGKDMKRL